MDIELNFGSVRTMDTERFQRAVAFLDSGEAAAALREFELVEESASNVEEKASILLGQVNCLTNLGRLTEARERWSESLACWRNPYTDFIEVALCFAEGRPDEALRKITEFLKGRDDLTQFGADDLYSDVAEQFSSLLFDRGLYSEAIEPFKEAILFGGTEERKRNMYLNLAICHIQTARLQEAEQIFSRILVIDHPDPLWPGVQYQLGRLYFKKGAYARARQAFEFSQLSATDQEWKENIPSWLSQIDMLLPPRRQTVT